MATTELSLAIRPLEKYVKTRQGQDVARLPQLDYFNAMRIYKQLCQGCDIIGVHRLRLLPPCLLNSYRARLRKQIKELKTALMGLSEDIGRMRRNNNQETISGNIAEDMISIIEQLICAMELFHCFMESQFKKKQQRIGQVDEADRVLIGIGRKIISIIEEKEKRERQGE